MNIKNHFKNKNILPNKWKQDDRIHHDIIAKEIYDNTVGPAWDQAYEEVTIDKWISNLKGKYPKLILEYGCGTGESALKMASKGWQIISFDHSIEMVKKTREKATRFSYDNLFYVQGDGERLPFKDYTFDVITARWILHHIPDVRKAAGELCRVLKVGGELYIAEISSKVSVIEKMIKYILGGGFLVFNNLTRDRFNKLKIYKNILPTHERAIDPNIILESLQLHGINYCDFHIPHIPVIYYYSSPKTSKKFVRILTKVWSAFNYKKATVLIIYGKKRC